ncbi:uncharacterized protein METZ01_LOCUS456386 [marine metagenome]|uniref:GYD domain-containing protein n=1 Tax=marine metagenome TaxID=408172 RepID=A0A383A6U3_9ZZZZ
MKYILLGSIDSKWLNKQSERYTKSSKKLKQLDIKLENVYYTQGQYDFVDVINAPGPESVLTFSIWYANKGFGRIQTLPAFGDKTMKQAQSR